MKAVKTQSWNSSEYQNLKLSLQREINPKPHLNTASVFIISVTGAIFLQPKIYFPLGFLLQGSYLFIFALMIHAHAHDAAHSHTEWAASINLFFAVIRKWENNLQNNISTTIFLGSHRSKSCKLNNNSCAEEWIWVCDIQAQMDLEVMRL